MNNIAALLQIRGKIVSVEAMIESCFFCKVFAKKLGLKVDLHFLKKSSLWL